MNKRVIYVGITAIVIGGVATKVINSVGTETNPVGTETAAATAESNKDNEHLLNRAFDGAVETSAKTVDITEKRRQRLEAAVELARISQKHKRQSEEWAKADAVAGELDNRVDIEPPSPTNQADARRQIETEQNRVDNQIEAESDPATRTKLIKYKELLNELAKGIQE